MSKNQAAAPKKSPKAPVKGAKAAEKEVTPAVKTKAPKAPKVHVETKADKARALFTSMAGSPRKDVIAAFKDQLSLTDAGAATYYQSIKAKSATAAPSA